MEIIAFLDGFDCALNMYAPEEVKGTGLKEFGRWLSSTHEGDERIWLKDGRERADNLVWWAKFRRLYPVDCEAFEALPLRYQQFLDDPRRVSGPHWPSSTDAA